MGRLREWYSQRRLRLGCGSLDCSGDRESWKQPDDTLLLYRCARKQATSNIVHQVVVFSDSYRPYGQDNGTPPGSDTYKFTGKPVSQTTGLYYYLHRWYDPTTGRFISPDPDANSISEPQSLNQYAYALDSPHNYIDPTGAGSVPTDVLSLYSKWWWSSTWAATHSMRMPMWLGLNLGTSGYRVDPSGRHTLWEGHREKFPGFRAETKTVSKFDIPSKDQPFYHLVTEGEHYSIRDPLGRVGEFFFEHGNGIGKAPLFLGIGFSAYHIGTAYEEDSSGGQGYSATELAFAEEAGSWGGAFLGAEFGAAIGTAVFPGVGILIVGAIGGLIGAVAGQEGVDWFSTQMSSQGRLSFARSFDDFVSSRAW
ncbi:MAG TPA: RHS repeat-associated core domain-containing protein [Candidatus Bathyarchaeia archaeon]